jgi:hypothetical protein
VNYASCNSNQYLRRNESALQWGLLRLRDADRLSSADRAGGAVDAAARTDDGAELSELREALKASAAR